MRSNEKKREQMSMVFMNKKMALFLACLVVLSVAAWAKEPPVSANPEAERLFRQGTENTVKGRLEEAEHDLTQAAILDPTNGRIHWELGWVFWKKQDWAQVVAHWEKTRALSPQQKDLDKYDRLARQYLAMEKESGTKAAVPPPPLEGSADALTFVVAGDLMMGSDFPNQSLMPMRDGAQLFDGVRGLLAGDVVFANLEGPLTKHPASYKCGGGSHCFAFRTPPRYVSRLKDAGFTVVNLANNHHLDFGYEGSEETVRVLDDAGVAAFGQTGRPSRVVVVKGVRVGFVGAATSPCCLHMNQMEKLETLVRQLREQADLVVVSFHGGAEGLDAAHVPAGPEKYHGEDRGDARRFAHRAIDAGADLVLGTGPHTVRGMERYKGRLIVYSLGNFMGYGRLSVTGHLSYSYLLRFSLNRSGEVSQLRVIPLKLDPMAVPAFDPHHRVVGLLNRLGREDFGEQAVQFLPDGSAER
ncbi:MAG: CapA family protein [Deltaproteobacteria bacterium]|nr:CapA family protein [Deltaproteobacteria bacterium]